MTEISLWPTIFLEVVDIGTLLYYPNIGYLGA